ncbi:MAG: ABC transporter permease [Rhizobiaceae bacterium]|nr:ABC transporter permease [Rhizobiaceae bacterium]MBO6727514.1 ABC transporter permease [Rhizobiaceae bacterium]
METVGIFGIVFGILLRFWPVWICLGLITALSIVFQSRLGLFGRLFNTGVGTTGVLLCAFWLFTAIFATWIAPFDPRVQIVVMKNAVPGAIEPETGIVFLLGGDHLARDVFSRIIYGAQIVLTIAPAATMIALLVGIALGLPSGYFGGKTDNVLSFLANLVLAFPVILLFYLLVTPGIMDTPIPYTMAGVLFLIPIIFFLVLFYTRFKERSEKLIPYVAITLVVGFWIYFGLVFDLDPLGIISIEPNELNIFVAVVFASSPGVFRIVRGLVMDIQTRDYVAAAQTRGETPWYIMLWEILPNARGPLIVDACLRIGYTTILLGTLGFFGLGMGPESPDWGTLIKDGSQVAQLRLYYWQGVSAAVALMSLVLGLNLLADSLREESLRD